MARRDPKHSDVAAPFGCGEWQPDPLEVENQRLREQLSDERREADALRYQIKREAPNAPRATTNGRKPFVIRGRF